MRLAERHRDPVEAHFTEGELDLEPPEELAITELDDEAILEVELDNEDLLEQDVDEDTLEDSLEVLIHGSDDDGEDDETEVNGAPSLTAPLTLALGAGPGRIDDFDDGLEADGDDRDDGDGDLEESLDLVLLDRLALRGDGEDHDEQEDDGAVLHSVLLEMPRDTIDVVAVAPCRSDEFVCRSCFLVRTRGQLADGTAMVCRDCSS
ncbi:MAG TPA: DUF4193 family protein [Acidimicrobiales bacterium]|nr:DUF4193 family protein [Acidimicrobiales bacterium]